MDYVNVDLDDRAEILELPNQYADAINTANTGKFGEVFLPDGVWDVSAANPEWRAQGRDAIRVQFEALRGAHEWVFQVVFQSIIISCEDKTATARTFVGEYANLRGDGRFLFAAYNDVCVKTRSGWYYKSRKFHPLYHGAPDLSDAPSLTAAPLSFD